MGRSAQVSVLGVSWGYQSVAELRHAGAERIVNSYSEVVPAIATLLNW